MEEALSVTRTTYRVSDFLSWQRQGTLDLRPPFQRGSVWSKKSKSFFIDTLVRGFPVPLVFLQDFTDPQTFEPKRVVVDGQQRLRTVLAYIDPNCLRDRDQADEFSVLKLHNRDLASRTFKELQSATQQRILQFQFSVHVLPPTTPDKLLLEVFARMNSTGTQLNDQELRNARFSGAFKQLVYGLSYEEVERWLSMGVFTRPQIGRMKDVELTSELIMLLRSGVAAKSQASINKTYEDLDDSVPNEKAISRRFVQLLDRIEETYSTELNSRSGFDFRSTPFNTQGWFYCLFSFLNDKVFGSTVTSSPEAKPRPINASKLRAHLDARKSALEAKGLPENLLKALRGAAADKSSRQQRLQFLEEGWRSA